MGKGPDSALRIARRGRLTWHARGGIGYLGAERAILRVIVEQEMFGVCP